MIDLSLTPISSIKGVGKKTAESLVKAGINTVLDLLRLYPRLYEDRTPRYMLEDAPLDTKVALIMRVTTSPRVAYTPTGKRIVRFSARQRENSPVVHIAYFNQPYLVNTFHVGEDYRFFGRISKSTSGYYMFSPVAEAIDSVSADTVPVYSLCKGLSSNKLSKIIRACLENLTPEDILDPLPRSVIIDNVLMSFGRALFEIHLPTSEDRLNKARERLIFDELFNFALSAERLKRREDTAIVPSMKRVDMKAFISSLPYPLTSAQERALREIESDLTSTKPPHRAMRRLLQGDVGSGKTVVAAGAMYIAVKNGGKAYLMAPTEILARQHHETLTNLFAPFNIEVGLLTGSTSARERRALRERLISDEPMVLVGTHALFEEETMPKNLTLVITDEQHRFGVGQREKLLSRATVGNNLTMSATPIPRTLAMFLYAGLDISILDELPPGRQKIDTLLIPPSKRERMYGFIEEQVALGHQAYIICPLVEESEEEKLEREISGSRGLMSATEMAESLKKRFSAYNVGLLHGKMKPSDKNEIMASFAKGDVDILVSTTVVEVGVNVPNATVMVVEDSDRFGLATLHQLRGRIGRGSAKSWCIFVTGTKSRDTLARLNFMTKCSDGFEIAEFDLQERGPGDFFGERQHGEIELPLASSFRDTSLLKKALDAAKNYCDKKEM